jgi:hypothetical protein
LHNNLIVGLGRLNNATQFAGQLFKAAAALEILDVVEQMKLRVPPAGQGDNHGQFSHPGISAEPLPAGLCGRSRGGAAVSAV